jgi:DNA-binding beta-propeller fold protein YncE
VISRIQTAPHPHGAAVLGDGRLFFTTVESDHTLFVLDTATDKVLKTTKLSGLPNQCAATPDGRYVGVPIRGSDSLDLVDVGKDKVVKSLSGKVPHNCYRHGRNDRLFVTSMGEDRGKRVDLKALRYAAESPVDGVPRPLAVTRDGRTLNCALSDRHRFVVRRALRAGRGHPRHLPARRGRPDGDGLALAPAQANPAARSAGPWQGLGHRRFATWLQLIGLRVNRASY